MRIHHWALRTTDVGRLEAFYAGVLGLAVTRRTEAGSVWLDAGGAVVMIEAAGPGEPGIPQDSREFVAFAIRPAERAPFRARLAAAGVAVEAESPFTLYFRDPDGRRVGLTHYPDPSP